MAHLSGLGPTIIAVVWIQTALAILLVLARLYTRQIIVRAYGHEDWLMVVTLLLFILYSSFTTVAALTGLGSHFSELTLEQFVWSNKMEIAGQTCNIFAIAASKSAVAAFLLRLVIVDWHKYFLYGCIASTTIVCFLCAILDFFQVTPIAAVFNPTIPHTVNFNFTANAIFSGSYTALMDFVLALFPWYFLAPVQLRKKERMTVCFGLSLGVLAGICGIVRAIELGALGTADYTLPLILWGSTELLVSIACATIPVLRPLYKKFRGQSKSSDDHSGPSKTGARSGPAYVLSSIRHDQFTAGERQKQYSAGGDSERGVSAAGMDNASDESIMRDAWRYGIKETTVVDISYDSARDVDTIEESRA
ncbi:hypothetical protein CJF30_00006767 [Rutstroemia sp. NJR-2017a BBW]|nr:hypothetical protein CJF30_00006767 [Rutstroemia sp. NJR-2017a BBW]